MSEIELSHYTIASSGTLLDAAHAIDHNRSRCVVVVENGKAIGVISEGDLVRALLRGTDIYSSLLPFIHHGILFLKEKDMKRALAMFLSHGISLIPILDDDFILRDVITMQELLKHVRLDLPGAG
jgi:CBS domain-containing protein